MTSKYHKPNERDEFETSPLYCNDCKKIFEVKVIENAREVVPEFVSGPTFSADKAVIHCGCGVFSMTDPRLWNYILKKA